MSYLNTIQSRGVGAVAAADLGHEPLGVVARPGLPTRSPAAAEVKSPTTTKPWGTRMIGVARPPRAQPRIYARPRASARYAPKAQTVIGKPGLLLPPRRQIIRTAPPMPRVMTHPVPIAPTTVSTHTAPTVLVARPGAGTNPAGIITGTPPATARPLTSGLVAKAEKKDQAKAAITQAAVTEAQLQVPEITPTTPSKAKPGSKKVLLIAGVGAAAIVLLLLMRRKP